jgi:hypothetical protein
MLVFVAMSIDLSLNGAYVTNAVERFHALGQSRRRGVSRRCLGYSYC